MLGLAIGYCTLLQITLNGVGNAYSMQNWIFGIIISLGRPHDKVLLGWCISTHQCAITNMVDIAAIILT